MRPALVVGVASNALLAVSALTPVLSVVDPAGDPLPPQVSRIACTAWVGCAATDAFPGSPTLVGWVAIAAAVLVSTLMLSAVALRGSPRTAVGLAWAQFVVAGVAGTWVVAALAVHLLQGNTYVGYHEWNYTVVVRPRWTILLVGVALIGIAFAALRAVSDSRTAWSFGAAE